MSPKGVEHNNPDATLGSTLSDFINVAERR